ncbi:MAG: BolA family transcriptional regulator [Alphaproteobacteria bacterium]|jgi:stress-induced morphogen|nr:BolA family transcriptional regulator [Alphaproteobacteria bacterium]|tara:strand:+ start:235 stop:465 length:231 start_codon:yes stop_codon:yes gene_type:complete
MKLSSNDIIEMIKKKLPDARIQIEDLRGDNNHYHATIESGEFKGLSKVQQHKIVYEALGNHMGTTLHALMLTTKEL